MQDVDFGKQHLEYKKVRTYYSNVKKKQLLRYFKKSLKIRDTLNPLVAILNRRLDVWVYELGFANSMFEAKQLISHSHIKVNGHYITIPSYQIKTGDSIQLCLVGNYSKIIERLKLSSNYEVNYKTLTVIVINPERSNQNIDDKKNFQLLVEYLG